MRSFRLRLVVICLVFFAVSVATSMQAETSIEMKQLLVVIKHDGSQGVVRINGIPAHRFSSELSHGQLVSDSISSLGMLAKNGANIITVDAAPSSPNQKASTEVSIIVATGSLDDLDKPLFTQKIEGTGTATRTVTLQGVPQWAFSSGAGWTGDKNAVLTAVKALHKAYVDHDFKTVETMQKAVYDDLIQVLGPDVGSYEDIAKEQRGLIKTGKLSPLAAQLTVESFYDGRLFVVSDKAGRAPIRLTSVEVGQDGDPREFLEIGTFWIYRDGKWSVIRIG